MRILPIALSILIIFTPAYSAYASMLPGKGQIVQIGKKGGALIRTGAGKVVKGGAIGIGIEGGRAVWAWCKNNQKKCKDKIGDAYEVICDITSCDVERKEDDNPENQCIARYDFSPQNNELLTLSAFLSELDNRTKIVGSNTIIYQQNDYTVADLESAAKNAIYASQNSKNWTRNDREFRHDYKVTNQDGKTMSQSSSKSYVKISVKCQIPSENKKLTEDELKQLAKKIADQMDDDDIINYYNTDYDDITINNYHYYGDDIDNETNIDNQCQNNSCNEISKEIEKDISNKKYDIDDVTPANCTMEENTGKYIACNMKIENEEDNSNKEGDTTNKDTVTKKEDEEEPYKCGTTDLTKKICSFIDWVESDYYDDEDDKLEIKEDEQDKPKTKVEFTGTCPAPYEIDISLDAGFMGTIDYDFVLLDTPKLCSFLDDWVEPIVYVLGPLHAIYILGGNRENV